MLCIAIVTLSVVAGANPDAWRVVHRDNTLTVFARNHPGSKIQELKAVAIVNARAEVLMRVVTDIESFTELIPHTTVARVIGAEGDAIISLQRLEMPMLDAREYVVASTKRITTLADGRRVFRSAWRPAPARFHASLSGKGIRVDVNEGSWTFEELPNGRTKATFWIHVDPAGALPRALVNVGQQMSIARYFENLNKRAALPVYAR